MSNELENTFLVKSLSDSYLKSDLANVHFAFPRDVGETIKVPANKTILAIASPVFRAMFFGPLKEKEVIDIVDSDESAFKEFLQFFYLPKVTLTMENMETVVRLADKYDMMEYLDKCVETFGSKLQMENVIWGLQLAISMNNEKLTEICESKIQFLTSDYFKSDIFLHCDREVLEHILQLDALNCSEFELFAACVEWAETTCESNGLDANDPNNLKNQLSDCLYLIRFRAMEYKEIYSIVSNEQYRGLFTGDDVIEIFRLKSNENFHSRIFENLTRTSSLKWNSSDALKRELGRFDRDIWTVIQKRESTWFSTNAPVILGHISIPRIMNSSDVIVDVNFTINIIEYKEHTFGSSGASKVLFTGTVQNTASSGAYGSISLTPPILINPKKFYEVRFDAGQTSTEVHHVWTWFSEVKLNETIVVKFHKSPSDTNNRGLVREFTCNLITK